MATKNKRRKPTKRHAGAKQKETAYDRLSRETDELMDQVAAVADNLIDLLPAFKRLSEKNRRLIYEQMNFVLMGLEDALDDYYETLPESEDDPEPGRGLPLGGILGLGLAMMLSRSSERRSDEDATKFNWPDAIDIEGGKVRRDPKLLNPAEDSESKGD